MVSQLKLADIEHQQGDIAAGRTAKTCKVGRGGRTAGRIGVASRSISTLRSLLNHARRLGLIEVSPAAGVRIMASQNLKRHLNAGEIRHMGDGHFIGVVPVLDRVCVRAGLKEVTPHTLRHSFASFAASLGFSELTISGLLGHAPRGVTQRYVHLDTALVIAADQVSAEIARLLAGGELQSMREVKQARTLASVRSVA